MNKSISQIRISIENWANRVEHVENRVWKTEYEVEELDQTVTEHEKNLKKIWMEHERYLRHHEKTKPMNHGYRRMKRGTN
jgi:uncharacterized coiled-coil protein SlyX